MNLMPKAEDGGFVEQKLSQTFVGECGRRPRIGIPLALLYVYILTISVKTTLR